MRLHYLILLFGFAVRMAAIDTTIIDGDRANPHGRNVVRKTFKPQIHLPMVFPHRPCHTTWPIAMAVAQ